ncbi:hypothetical protein [Streptomyces sp. NBC_00356]|uniref:hypothetical protein n=1 Tax=Streptomyces sp. NBC_00356 TaxID=2975724 RepID=UPI002E25C074
MTTDRIRQARRRLNSALVAVEPRLSTPYPDALDWTPWTRFVAPALKELAEALDAPVPVPVDRPAVLREAADAIVAEFPGPDLDRYTRYGADFLRRMADEAQQAEPARLLDCGLCYEENGEEVHPHPACTADRLAALEAEHQRWAGVRDIVERAIDKGWSVIDTYQLEDALGSVADEAQQVGESRG